MIRDNVPSASALVFSLRILIIELCEYLGCDGFMLFQSELICKLLFAAPRKATKKEFHLGT